MTILLRSLLRSPYHQRYAAIGIVGAVGYGSWTVQQQNNSSALTLCEENKNNTISKKDTPAVIPTDPTLPKYSLLQQMAAEAIGTGIIVSGGCGAVCASKFGGAPLGLMHIATAFGMSVALAVYCTRDVSGAHLNPAITASLAWHHPETVPNPTEYILAQVTGAAVAATFNHAMYSKGIEALHQADKITRGTAKSSALLNGAFHMIPNNALVKTLGGALLVEIGLTTGLAFGVYALTDAKKTVPTGAQPALVGTTVAALVVAGAPLTGCGMNPARDLGPRLIAATAGGLGKTALAAAWVYTLGPVLGAIAGGYLYQAIA